MADESAKSVAATPRASVDSSMPQTSNIAVSLDTAASAHVKPTPVLVGNTTQTDSTMEGAAASANESINGHVPPTHQIAPPPTTVEREHLQTGSGGELGDTSAAVVASTTPATSAKKGANGSAKKRITGVPEHRSKKSHAGKKKPKPTLHLDAKPGALFLARMKGHQPWPSIICDEEMLPLILINSRPNTAAQADGTFKKADHAPGGRREHERSFPVMFLYTNEFAWITNTELTTITPDECKEASTKQKSKTLTEAYNVAAHGHDLAYFKKMLAEHQEMLNAEVEAKAERESKKAEKVAKQKRKSDAATIKEDKMDVDESGSQSKPKKRKKDANADDNEKPAKNAKMGATKLKLNVTPKAQAPEASKKNATKAKSSAKKSATKASASDDDEAPKQTEDVLSPSQIREKKEKEVRYIRHKLQKGFLSRDTVPGDDEIETMSNYLSKVEAHPGLESSILRATKIHKVLKAMIRLESIPKDDEFQFKKRCRELLDKWNKTLASDPNPTADKDEDGKPDGVGAKSNDTDAAPKYAQGDVKNGEGSHIEHKSKEPTTSDPANREEVDAETGNNSLEPANTKPGELGDQARKEEPQVEESTPKDLKDTHNIAPGSVEATA